MKKFNLLTIFVFSVTLLNAQWVTQFSGTSTYLTSVFFPSAETGYVTKEDGGLLKTTNGGSNWSFVSPAGTAGNIYFTAKDTGYSVSDNNIKKTTNGAVSWVTKHTATTINYFLSIFFADKNTGYALGTDSTFNSYSIYKTINAGENWFLQSTIPLQFSIPVLFFTDVNNGYLVNYSSTIYKTTDGGLNWSAHVVDPTGEAEIHSMHFPSSDVGYVVGMDYITGIIIYKTTDAGLTWTQQITQETNPLYSVYFNNNDTGYAVGGNGFSSGTVIKTTNGGANWTLATAQAQTFNSVCFPDNNTGYAVGTNGTIIKYSDNTSDVEKENFMQQKNSSLIFPNPNTGKFLVEINDEVPINTTIELRDLLGKTVYSNAILQNSSTIDLTGNPAGIYFITVCAGKDCWLGKVVKD